MPNIYISYAWNDPEHKKENNREEIVDKLCEAFKEKGFKINRDKTEIKYKDSIRDFANDIASADIVIAVISKKYLESVWCMFELVQT